MPFSRPDAQTAPRAEQVEAALWACDLRDGRTLSPGLVNDARNVRYPLGRPETRKGVIKPAWANRTTAGRDTIAPYGSGYGAATFRDPSGTVDWQIVAADGYAWRSRPHNQSVQIPLPEGVRLLSRCTFVQAFNKLFCFRGRYVAPLMLTSLDTGFADLLEHWNSTDTWQQTTDEVFYGPFQEVSTPVLLSAGQLTSASTTATVTHNDHGLSTGDLVTIFGATQTEYNGTFSITVTGVNTFTYPFAGSATTPATGTIYYVKSGLTRSGNTATVVTATPHGFVTGADVTIRGANASAYNGRFNITVLNDTTFTFPVAGAPATPDVGTVVCSNMAWAWRAAGTLLTLTSLTRSSATATATKNGHGFSNGDTVTIAGATGADATLYNGTFVISNVTANTFDYTMSGTPAGSPASGTITARLHRVLAGESPDSHPDSWTRIYDILPNADTALFVNNRLLVPTAYTPSTTGYNSTAVSYTKVDFLVATDIQDEIHFDFVDEFRINQGSADEIVDLAKWSENAVVIWKGSSWGVLTGVAPDLSGVGFDLRSKSYGLTARGAWAEAGDNITFVSHRRGFVNIRQSESGKLIGVDVPMSAPIQKLIDRIDWTKADQIRLADWNSHLYAAVPLDHASANNALLVFSFVSAAQLQQDAAAGQQGWLPLDTGSALTVLDWFKLSLDGVERLFFLSPDGWVNLMEESDRGDQIAATETTYNQGLAWEEIDTRVRFRPQGNQLERLQSPLGADLALETFNPSYSLTAHFEGVNKQTVLASEVTRSATRYFKPWDAPAWDDTNLNNDHAVPYREDYRVQFVTHSLIPETAAYSIGGTYWLTTLTVGQAYVLNVAPATSLYVIHGTITVNEFGTPVIADGITLPIVPGADYEFTSTKTGLFFGSLDLEAPLNAQLVHLGIWWQAGLQLLLMQESLCHFRMSGRQGRSVALELINTQGRVRWQGLRTVSRAGRARKGIQV